jgi:hypothetical protein
MRNIILVTTKWSDSPLQIALQREEQLNTTYWNEMLNKGSRMARFDRTSASAWEILGLIVAEQKKSDLLMERNQRRLPSAIWNASQSTLRRAALSFCGLVSLSIAISWK